MIALRPLVRLAVLTVVFAACDGADLLQPPPPETRVIEAVPSTPATPPGFGSFQGDASSHSGANAYLLAYLSHYVYLPSVGADLATFEEKFEQLVSPLGLSNLTFIKDALSDTEVVVGETADAVIVTFRGTETLAPTEIGDVVDLAIDAAIFEVDGIHAGFLGGVTAVLPAVRTAIAGAGDKKVWLTGHSLGGALAKVAAYLLETQSPTIQVQGVYTYGAPRVFFDTRAAAFDARFGDRAQRWVNHRDPIPRIPSYTPVVAMPPGVDPLSLPYTHTRVLNNILPQGEGCSIVRNDQEIFLQDPQWVEETAATLGLPGLALIAAELLTTSGDLADHDTKRYVGRIYASLPAETRALLPSPPYPEPADDLTSCDGPQDTSPPVVTATVVGTLGQADWFVGDVTVSWSVSDPESAVISTLGCTTTVVTQDTDGLILTCEAVSEGGTTRESVTVKRDATPPAAVVPVPDRAPDANGWYNQPVSVTWSGSDATSGIGQCSQETYGGPDTDAGRLSGTCTDQAGNVSDPAPFDFRYDATAPLITITTPPVGADYFLDQVVAADYACVDAGSGVAACAGPVPAGGNVDTGSFGSRDFTVDAMDVAGNPATLVRSYTVSYAFDGFYAPVANLPEVNSARAGQRIAFKWNLLGADGLPVADDPSRFAVGWSEAFACGGGGPATDVVTSETAGASGLRWDPDAGQYVFVAASARSDAGLCRYLVVGVGPWASARALVSFVR